MELLFEGDRGAGVVVLGAPGEIVHLIEAFEQIAVEQGWQPGDQLRRNAPHSVHFAAYVGASLAGGMQLVQTRDGEQLPCEAVWPEVTLPRREQTAHISIMAVWPEYRGSGGLLWPICVAMWRYCATNRIADISLEVTPKTMRLYQRLGWPLEIIGELRPHWGEECYLCRMEVTRVAGAMVVKAMQSTSYREIVNLMSRPSDVSMPLQQEQVLETIEAKDS